MGLRHPLITLGSAVEHRLSQVKKFPAGVKTKKGGKPGPPIPGAGPKKAPKPAVGAKKRKKQTPAQRRASLANLAKAREAGGG